MAYKSISKDIIRSLNNFVKRKHTPLHIPFFTDDDARNVAKCVRSSYVSSVSKQTNLFEEKIKKFTKSNYAIATINGTAAIQIAIKACGIKKNDEILIPNLNYIGSSNASIYCNAIPHFVDVENEAFGVDVKKLDKYLNETTIKKNKLLINRKTKRPIKAIMPTHVFGNTSNILEVVKLGKKYNLKIIEDASESLGSFYKNQHLGTFSDIGILSFNGNKIITTGGGGALLIKEKKIYNKALSLSTIARKKTFNWDYDYEELGYNYRLPGLNSSLGISQFKKISKILKLKKKIYLSYKKKFKNHKKFKFIETSKDLKSNHWLNTIYLYNSNIKLRNKVIKEVNKKFIGVRPVWKLMHQIKHLSKYPRMDISNSIKIEKGLINLPSSPYLYEKL